MKICVKIYELNNPNRFTQVMRENFNNEMMKYEKKPWTSASVAEVVKEILAFEKNETKRTKKQYNLNQKYGTMEVDGRTLLVKKVSRDSDPVIVIPPAEEYFEILLEIHRSTGHGGRDRMLFALKNRFYITVHAINIFLNLCKICNTKKTQKHPNLVVRPLTSDDFNSRGQVDLIDFQSTPFQDYKWVMAYQDHLTKYCHLRPLKSKEVAEVASELWKIFIDFGAPFILQSDNGREFVAKIIEELARMWPQLKLVHGRPRHPKLQGSVERCNQDVELMLQAWLQDNNTSDWVTACRFVQWQKNTSKHRVIGRSPYCALFGGAPKTGLAATSVPHEILAKLSTEEELRKFCTVPEINVNRGHEDGGNVSGEGEKGSSDGDFNTSACSKCSAVIEGPSSSAACLPCGREKILENSAKRRE